MVPKFRMPAHFGWPNERADVQFACRPPALWAKGAAAGRAELNSGLLAIAQAVGSHIQTRPPSTVLAGRASRVEALYPGPFNAGLFMLMYFFATMFEEVRRAVHAVFA